MVDPLSDFYKKDQIRVLYVSSMSTGMQSLFPLVKEKDNRGVLVKLKLLRMASKGINFSDRPTETPHDSFSIRSDEFGDFKDSLVIVGFNEIKVFDKHLKLRISVKGLNIRSSIDIH